jgi:hypothetical protein
MMEDAMNEIITREELKIIEAMEYTEVQPITEYVPDFLDSFEELEEEMDADIDIWSDPEDECCRDYADVANFFAA